MNAIKIIWNTILVMTVVTVFKQNDSFRDIVLIILSKLKLVIFYLIELINR